MTLLNTNYACFHFDEWRNGEIAEMEKIGGMEKFDECFHFKNRGIPSTCGSVPGLPCGTAGSLILRSSSGSMPSFILSISSQPSHCGHFGTTSDLILVIQITAVQTINTAPANKIYTSTSSRVNTNLSKLVF